MSEQEAPTAALQEETTVPQDIEPLRRVSERDSNAGPETTAETQGEQDDDGMAAKRPRFGTRYLTADADVFQHNAWDNVEWNAEREAEAQAAINKQNHTPASQQRMDELLGNAGHHWDEFYSNHQNKFFKDRHWLFTEFPELLPTTTPAPLPPAVDTTTAVVEAEGAATTTTSDAHSSERAAVASTASDAGSTAHVPPTPIQAVNLAVADESVAHASTAIEIAADTKESVAALSKHANKRWMEVGCGVGNTVFPLLKHNKDADLFLYACDFSAVAVDIVRGSAEYEKKRCFGFVHDIGSDDDIPLPDNTLDVIIMVFVLSALPPARFKIAVSKLVRCLKPGGVILFRDYGKYDLTQLRFKQSRYLCDSLYVRGDNTLVYFFTQEELRELFEGCGLIEEQNHADRRLIVNRSKHTTMNRIWLQCKYRKPLL